MLTDDEVGKILSVRSFTHAIARGDRYTRTHTYTQGHSEPHGNKHLQQNQWWLSRSENAFPRDAGTMGRKGWNYEKEA